MSEAATVVVPMPHMGVSVEEGTVVEWLVAVGDEVKAEDVLCAIATDKVDTEVVAPADGVVVRLLVEVDGEVAVGGGLVELAVGDEAAAAFAEAAEGPEVGSADATPRVAAAADPDTGAGAGIDSADATQRGESEADASGRSGASRG
ncbi:MAG: biotin/lipoyl-containing protein, partial [Solirubrobacterales bacterium]